MDCNLPGFPVHHQLLEFTQTRVHRVSDAIQPPDPGKPNMLGSNKARGPQLSSLSSSTWELQQPKLLSSGARAPQEKPLQ